MSIAELGHEGATASATEAGRRTLRWRLVALALLLPALGFLLFGSAGRDDSYITYWAADRLRSTGHITNYNGRAVEQSSSLLHVVVLAFVRFVTRSSVATVGPWFAVAFGVACVPVAYALGARPQTRGGWMAASLVATLPPLVYWSFGGLDTSLATAVVLVVLLVTISADSN